MDLLNFFSLNNLLIVAIGFLVILLLPKPSKILKYLAVHGTLGVLVMFLINFFLPFYVNINLYTVAFSALLGLPGTLAMYVFNFL
ncbi:MAG: pro-sigmaK processing inhibitor BofA family protein [Defluviitaleaceae bacterium]|nr:pro-sigmaK processing inhibitor BofA family protein [Defluviitaleaceae bacterium]